MGAGPEISKSFDFQKPGIIHIVSDEREFLSKSLSHREIYPTEVFGRRIYTSPHTLSPQYSYSSRFIIRNWDLEAGMDVLDMGTGSGVLAIFAALIEARRVVAVDLNPHCAPILKMNSNLHGVEKIVEFIPSNLFEALQPSQKFDRIVFHAAYLDKPALSDEPLEMALFDPGYKSLNIFFSKAKDFLKPKGKILLGFAEHGNIEKAEAIIDQNGFTIERSVSEVKGHKRYLIFIVPK